MAFVCCGFPVFRCFCTEASILLCIFDIFLKKSIFDFTTGVSIGIFFSGREWLLSLAHCRVWHELRRPSGNSVNKLFNSCRYAKQGSAFCV